MKTAEEKATSFLNNAEWKILPIDKIEMKRALILLLKEQDRDTRHACAEAVSLLRSQMGQGGDPFVAGHAACMNVKAV